tara:strand:- start:4510 stop:5019 length:510 start_codon:yes stop_codon:yes gene_type:complete
MKKKELIHVGTFGQPQGLRGLIRINILTLSFDSFKNLKNYFFKENKSNLKFKSLKKIGKNFIASLEGCDDRNNALKYKGKKIFSLRENFPKTKNNEYYVIDIIGCDVFNAKKIFLGKVIDIKNFGAGDLLELIFSNKKKFYIPMNKDNVIDIDVHKKKIIADPILGILD